MQKCNFVQPGDLLNSIIVYPDIKDFKHIQIDNYISFETKKQKQDTTY